jgi:hypothetical protein
MKMQLSELTDKQLDRLHGKAFQRMTRGDSHYLRDYTLRTLRRDRLGWFKVFEAVGREFRRRATIQWPMVLATQHMIEF